MNAMDIRKREAKVFLMSKQIEDIEENLTTAKENNNQQNAQQLDEEMNVLHRNIQ